MSKNNAIVPFEASDNHISIRIPKQDFGKFVEDLIKTKRKFSRRFDNIFEFEKKDIVDIIETINHRVKEQNTYISYSCELNVYYQDGSQRSYSSLDQLIDFNDNFSSTSVKLTAVLIYFVVFPDNSSDSVDTLPAKQTIYISVSGDQMQRVNESMSMRFGGDIFIQIETNRFTWADDLMNFLASKINSKFRKPSFLERNSIFIRRNILPFALVFSMMVLTLYTVFLFASPPSSLKHDSIELTETYNHVLNIEDSNIETINQKLDFVIKRTNHSISINEHFENALASFIKATLFFIVCIIFSFMSIIPFSIAKRHVILNSYTKSMVDDKNRKIYFLNIIIISGFIISFASNASVVMLFG